MLVGNLRGPAVIRILRPEQPFTGVSRPSGFKMAKNVSKRAFLGVCKRVPENYPKKSKNHPKLDFLAYFFSFSGIFRDFFCRPPKRLFLRFFAILGVEGLETPVDGRSGRKISIIARESLVAKVSQAALHGMTSTGVATLEVRKGCNRLVPLQSLGTPKPPSAF